MQLVENMKKLIKFVRLKSQIMMSNAEQSASKQMNFGFSNTI